jgi:hypothetical protein
MCRRPRSFIPSFSNFRLPHEPSKTLGINTHASLERGAAEVRDIVALLFYIVASVP